jgi:hypothetical protein
MKMVKKIPTIQTITNMNCFVEYDKWLMFEFLGLVLLAFQTYD